MVAPLVGIGTWGGRCTCFSSNIGRSLPAGLFLRISVGTFGRRSDGVPSTRRCDTKREKDDKRQASMEWNTAN